MEVLKQKLANTVKSRRLSMKLSQEQLAEKIDKSPSFVGQLERGECLPKIETLQALIACLGIDANELFANNSITQDDMTELFHLALHMDENKRLFLLEFARMLHKMPLQSAKE